MLIISEPTDRSWQLWDCGLCSVTRLDGVSPDVVTGDLPEPILSILDEINTVLPSEGFPRDAIQGA